MTTKNYYRSHRTEILAREKAKRAADREGFSAKKKALYLKNHERKLFVKREWAAKNREKIVEQARKRRARPGATQRERENEYFRKYGITLAQKKQRIEDQGNKCGNPGCETVEFGVGRGQGWNTDHDHRNLKLRGELCPNCNKALGLVHDSVERLEGLSQYLRYWRDQHNRTAQRDGIIGQCRNREGD